MGVPPKDTMTLWTVNASSKQERGTTSTMSSLRVHHETPWTRKNPFTHKKTHQQVQPKPFCTTTTTTRANTTTGQLPKEVMELKQKILASHHEKCYRFRMTSLKKKAIPVALPKPFDNKRAMSTVVGGHRVAMTRGMWENNKKKTLVQMNRIRENAPYEYLW